MRRLAITLFCFVAALLLAGCADRKVTRVDTAQVTDLSGRWNDTDSRLVSNEMITDLLSAKWIPMYEERAMVNNGSVRLVQAGAKREELRDEREQHNQGYVLPETAKKWGRELGADFMLQGTINSIVDSYKKNKAVFYQIDLEMTNLESGEIVWMGNKKIKKTIADRF